VRSPGEYIHAHIPGAYSLPLFTDEERAVVGTAYKQESREQAIKHGLDFFGPKMKKMVEEVEGIVKTREGTRGQTGTETGLTGTGGVVLLYCWRGGMRSGAVAWLLDVYGFKVYTLSGGYKKFRNYVLDTFHLPFRFNMLGGYTGSGKTEVLKELRRNGEHVIDLEDLAKHKGSAFGNIGMPIQPKQEMFENLLCFELRALNKAGAESEQHNLPYSITAVSPFTLHPSPIWLEDESQRIGQVNIPPALWRNMRSSPLFFLNIPFEERLKHITDEYGTLDRKRMIVSISRIKERLGGLEAKRATEMMENGDIPGSFRILLKYYDKWYEKGLHNRDDLNSLLQIINCSSVTTENAKNLVRRPVYHENS